MKPKQRKGGHRPGGSNNNGGAGNRNQRIISAVVGKSGQARRAYDQSGLRPTVPEMVASGMPDMAIAGRIAVGLSGLDNLPPGAESAIKSFANNHPDVIEEIGRSAGLAIR